MTTLTPEALDQAAARMAPAPLKPAEAKAWENLTAGYQRTAPASRDARQLLHGKTVDDLIAEAGITKHGRRPEAEYRLPRGRVGAALPDWANRNSRDSSQPPSRILDASVQVLEELGWQAKPGRLRDLRGRRCICGAICLVHQRGIGSVEGARAAAWFVLAELREAHRWPRLIGDWNQVPGRTAAQAIGLVHAAHNRALAAGQ